MIPSISETELNLLMNFIKDALQDVEQAAQDKKPEKCKAGVDKILEHIQQYLKIESRHCAVG